MHAKKYEKNTTSSYGGRLWHINHDTSHNARCYVIFYAMLYFMLCCVVLCSVIVMLCHNYVVWRCVIMHVVLCLKYCMLCMGCMYVQRKFRSETSQYGELKKQRRAVESED